MLATSVLQRLNRYAVYSVSSILGILGVITFAMSAQKSDGMVSVLGFLGIFAGFLPATLAHEFGHAIFGRLAGWRIWIVSVGPFSVRLNPLQRIRMTSSIGRDAGGFVVGTPMSALANTKWRYIVFCLGGPVLSLVTGVTAFLFAGPFWPFLPPYDDYPQALRGYVLAFAFMSLGCAALTIWPFRTAKGLGNDGANILSTFFSKTWVSATGYGGQLLQFGVEHARWPAWIKEHVAADLGKDQPSREALYISFIHSVATNPARAKETAAKIENVDPDLYLLLTAFMGAVFDNDVYAAESALIRVQRDLSLWPGARRMRELTLAAIDAADGDFKSARQRLNAVELQVHQGAFSDLIWERILRQARASPCFAALQ